MRFRAGGVRFAVGPEARLGADDRAALGALDPDDADGPVDVRVEILDREPWTDEDPALRPTLEPAVLRWVGGRLLSSHASFTAEIDAFGGRALLHRRAERPYPLQAVVRTAMLARLPLLGGLPFHAAGVAAEGRGLVFFGPSGAGKTTLARTSPFPVLSDELVAVVPGAPFTLVRSGFWGESTPAMPADGVPLAGLVELAKGPSFRLERLAAAEAAGRIVGSVPVPFAPALWSRALGVVARLVAEVPVYRLEWRPDEPPLARLAGLLAAAPTART